MKNIDFIGVIKTLGAWLKRGYWALCFLLGFFISTSTYFVLFPNQGIHSFIQFNDITYSLKYLICYPVVLLIVLLVCFVKREVFRKQTFVLLALLVLAVLSLFLREKSQFLDFIAIDLLALTITSFVLLAFYEKIKNLLDENKWVIYIPFIAVLLAFLSLSLFRHFSFNSHAYDLGLYNQAFYKIAHFDFDNTVRKLPNIWGDHFTPVFVPISWLYWLFPFSATMLVVQSLIVVAGGVPLFFLARDVFKSRAAATVSVTTYFLSIGLASAISFDFHFITIATAFFIWAFYCAYKKNWLWYFIALILLLSCKEDISIIATFFGIFLIFYRGLKIGLITTILSGIWFIALSKFVMPHLSDAGFIYFSYSTLGATPISALKSLVLNPMHAIDALQSTSVKQLTLLNYFGSYSFLLFLAPTFLIIALPALGENLWNDAPSRWGGFHYQAFPSAVLAIVAIFAIYSISKLFNERSRERVVIFLTSLCLVSTILVGFYSRTPLLSVLKPSHYKLGSEVWQAKRLISTIDKKASITANHSVVPQMALRDQIYEFPGCKPEVKCLNTDYFVWSLVGSSWPMEKESLVAEIKAFLNKDGYRSDYGLYRYNSSAYVFKKGFSADPNEVGRARQNLEKYELENIL